MASAARSKRFSEVVLAAVVGALAGAGCGGGKSNDYGVLIAPYELGNHRDCKSLGVVTVRAELDDGMEAAEVDCDAGELRFNSLKPGQYDLVVYGIDANGVRVMDSLAQGPVSVDVIGGGTSVVVDPAVKLTAAPAKVLLRWDLGFGSCESDAIQNFQVSAWRSDGSELLMKTAVACSTAGKGRDQYRTIPDPDRSLSGDELGEVDVQPLDAHALPMGKSVTFSFDSPGPGGEVKLSVSCDSGTCKGSGAPD